MKLAKPGLIVACVMLLPDIVSHAYAIYSTEQRLQAYMVPINEEGLAGMHAVQGTIANYHRAMYFHLGFCIWYFAIIGLIIFAIRSMKNSN